MQSPPLILAVDDNPAALEILAARLSAAGYQVIIAQDGEEGLALARKALPDLVLLDIMMPKLDGIEVCRRLKTAPDLPFIPIIMVTARTDAQDIVAGLEAGSDEYLTKPVDHAALMARVKSMLRIKDLQDTVQAQAARLKAQLKTAAKIQALFWPTMPKLGGGGHIWARSRPAAYVGGDLYDVIALADGSAVAYVADVSGKGAAAALLMAALSTQIRTAAARQHEIDQLLASVNKTFYHLASEEGFFATVVMVRFWADDGRLQLVSAGHPPPLFVANGKAHNFPIQTGVALGATPDAYCPRTEHRMARGEALLLFSDGVLEAEDLRREHFGAERMIHHIEQAGGGPPWGEGLLQAVDRWRGEGGLSDDITLMEIWRENPG